MSTQLSQIAKKAKLDRTVRFTSLAHLLTPEFLTETWGMMNRRAASGIDGESTEQFESELKKFAHSFEPAPIAHHRSGGLKYPKDQAKPERAHWGSRRTGHIAPHTVCVGDAGWR